MADALNTYSYDAEGNLISKTITSSGNVWSYSYDLRNRMTSAVETTSAGGTVLSKSSYSYDLSDRRITKTINGSTTQFFYEGDNLWKQAAGGNVTRYLGGGAVDQWLARFNSNGVNWYLIDRLGSVTGITDATGALINTTQYDSYGHILSQSNPAVADQLAFTGREFDSETGNYYYRARYYDPNLGKFQSEDPIANKNLLMKQMPGVSPLSGLTINNQSGLTLSPFQAGDFNLHRYVTNAPLNFTDQSGEGPSFSENPKPRGQQEYLIILRFEGSGSYSLLIKEPAYEASLYGRYLGLNAARRWAWLLVDEFEATGVFYDVP